jgi:hypothetical protein
MASSEAFWPEQGVDEIPHQQQGDGDTDDIFEIHGGFPSHAVAAGHVGPAQGKEAHGGNDKDEVEHGELLLAASVRGLR